MAFASMGDHDSDESLAEINMIPLIDVMLVLLVIFIVTAPLLTHAVKVDLPKASSTPNLTKPDNIQVAIKSSGEIFWNGQVITQEELELHLQEAAKLDPQPELHLRADQATPYGEVAEVMSASARYGLTKLGFITDPSTAPQ